VKVMQVPGGVEEGSPSADKAYEALLVSARGFDLVLLDGSEVLPDQSWRRTLFIDDVVLVIHRNPAGGARIGNALETARSATENVTGAVLVG